MTDFYNGGESLPPAKYSFSEAGAKLKPKTPQVTPVLRHLLNQEELWRQVEPEFTGKSAGGRAHLDRDQAVITILNYDRRKNGNELNKIVELHDLNRWYIGTKLTALLKSRFELEGGRIVGLLAGPDSSQF